MARFSVILPAYNQSAYLRDAIESVLAQSCPDFELIIVDDGSTDNTRDVVESYKDSRIQYIYQENRGLSGARNTGIRRSNGMYLTYLDADDLFTPQKLKVLGDALDKDQSLGFVAGQAIPIDEVGRIIGQLFDSPPPQESHGWLLGNPLHVGSVLVRREWQEQAGFFDERLRSYEDWDMWLRLARLGCRFGWVAEPVSLYRFHPKQMTRNSQQMTQATFAVLDKVFCDPNLPADWLELRNAAYSNAHLRAAASFYNIQDYDQAQTHLREAINLNPDLIMEDGKLLARRLMGFANSPKHSDPWMFIQNIYDHLPHELEHFRRKHRKALGEFAVQLGFQAHQAGNLKKARYYMIRAIRCHPSYLGNPGVISLMIGRTRVH